MTKTIQETMTYIQAEARAKAAQEVRYVEKMSIGQVAQQGDIYVHRVKADHPRGAKASRQLVQGATQGSRHMAEAPARIFEGKQAPEWASRALVGPVIETEKRFQITHPEHAWLDLPAGTYQVTFQRDARTNEAVKD